MTAFKILYIGTLFVEKTLRHQGFGTQLMHEAERRAKELGANMVDLTRSTGKAAVSMRSSATRRLADMKTLPTASRNTSLVKRILKMIEIKKLAVTDGEDIYEMLQEMPADENGFVNSVHGKTYEEYIGWLAESAKASEQTGLVDGWKVPQTTFWLYEDGRPVGMGKIRHFLTDALRIAGGNIGYAIRPSDIKNTAARQKNI